MYWLSTGGFAPSVRERGKNLSTVTDGETFSDLWMDDLIYMPLLSTPVTIFVQTEILMGMGWSLVF
jgi:hypothetical protein